MVILLTIIFSFVCIFTNKNFAIYQVSAVTVKKNIIIAQFFLTGIPIEMMLIAGMLE